MSGKSGNKKSSEQIGGSVASVLSNKEDILT